MTGCFYTAPVKVDPPEVFECHNQTCTVEVRIFFEDLIGCYGESAVLPPELSGCDPVTSDCDLVIYNQSDLVPGCCLYPDDVDAGLDNCCAEMDIGEVASATLALSDFATFMSGECGGLSYSVFRDECKHVPGLEEPIPTGEECDELSANAIGADFDLVVDPALSFVSIDSQTIGQATSTISGSGGAAVVSTSFLRAYMTGTPVNLQVGYLYDVEIVLWDEALMWANNGNFWVPSGQINGLTVQGTIGGGPVAWDVLGDGSPANGVLDTTAGTWYLNYLVSDVDGTFEVHLEGAATAL